MMDNRTEKENSQLEDEVLADASPEGSQDKKLARYAAAKSRQGQVSDYILKQTEKNPIPTLKRSMNPSRNAVHFSYFGIISPWTCTSSFQA